MVYVYMCVYCVVMWVLLYVWSFNSCTIVTFPRVVSRWVEVCSVIVFVYWCSFRGSLSSALNLSSSFGVSSCGCIWY